MDINLRKEGDVAILDMKGKLIIGSGDSTLREEFAYALSQGEKKLILNMKGVKTVDSSGLGELIRCKVTATKDGAEVKLLNLDLKVYKLIAMSQLVGVFETYDDEVKALESYQESTPPTTGPLDD